MKKSERGVTLIELLIAGTRVALRLGKLSALNAGGTRASGLMRMPFSERGPALIELLIAGMRTALPPGKLNPSDLAAARALGQGR